MEPPLLEVSLPNLPPSVNTHHIFRIQGGRIKVALSAEASKWRTDATLFLKPAKLRDDILYRVEIALVAKWLDRRGLPIRKDCRNHAKLILDTVCARYQIDDKLIWSDLCFKVHDTEKEQVIFKMWKYDK